MGVDVLVLRAALQQAGLDGSRATRLVANLRKRGFALRACEPPKCHDCGGHNEWYMVHDTVWETAWPDHQAVLDALIAAYDPKATHAQNVQTFLCLDCLERRLGRWLTADDFDFALPINDGIAIGLKVAAR